MNEKIMWLINTTPYGIGENCVFLFFVKISYCKCPPPLPRTHFRAWSRDELQYIKKDNSNTEDVTRRCKQKQKPGIAQLIW